MIFYQAIFVLSVMGKEQVIYQQINNISYQEAWDLQTSIQQALIKAKLAKRNLSIIKLRSFTQKHRFILCEHNPVYTLGKSGTIDNLLLNEQELNENHIEYFKINRGGDITYHGPGQITGYPILDLDCFFTDVHKYVRTIEEIIIRVLNHYNINGSRIKGFTGVWVKSEDPELPHRKIAAIGVHLSRWVTMHGFALNVNTDLSYFDNIIPCGIVDEDKTITSIENEVGKYIDMNEVRELLKINFAQLFDCNLVKEPIINKIQ